MLFQDLLWFFSYSTLFHDLSLYGMGLAAEFLRKHPFSIYLKFHNDAFLRLFHVSMINIIQIHILMKILSFHKWRKYLILKLTTGSWLLWWQWSKKEGGKTSAYRVLKATSWCLDVPCPGPGCMIKSSPSELVLVWKNV